MALESEMMKTSETARQPWLRWVLLLGVVYLIVGLVFGTLTSPFQTRVWRLAAWAVSGAVFAAQIAYEHLQWRNSPRSIALHAAMASAIGAFLLAVAATVHRVWVPPTGDFHLFLIALV